MADIKNYRVILETKSPVFIGSGEQIQKYEYYIDQRAKKIYVFDASKLFSGLRALRLENEYCDMMLDNRPPRERKYRSLCDFFQKNRIEKIKYMPWVRYTLDSTDISDIQIRDINTFVKDAYGKPYVPGSSLKGAIRTAIFNVTLLKNKDALKNIATNIQKADTYGISAKKYLKDEVKELECKVFNKLNRNEKKKEDILNDYFSEIVVGDSKPLECSDLILCQKIDLLANGEKNSLPILRECLKPGTKIEMEVRINEAKFKYPADKLPAIAKLAMDENSKLLSNHFSKGQDIPKPPVGRQIFLGGGSGFFSKTAVYSLYENEADAVSVAQRNFQVTVKKYKEHKHDLDKVEFKISPHTRKLTKYKGEYYDMGLCSIEFQPIS